MAVIELPYVRAELLLCLAELHDLRLHRQEWSRRTGDIANVIDSLEAKGAIDGNADELIGGCLRNDVEARAIDALAKAIDLLIRDVADAAWEKNDLVMAQPAWYAVVDAARNAYSALISGGFGRQEIIDSLSWLTTFSSDLNDPSIDETGRTVYSILWMNNCLDGRAIDCLGHSLVSREEVYAIDRFATEFSIIVMSSSWNATAYASHAHFPMLVQKAMLALELLTRG